MNVPALGHREKTARVGVGVRGGGEPVKPQAHYVSHCPDFFSLLPSVSSLAHSVSAHIVSHTKAMPTNTDVFVRENAQSL